MTLKEAVLKSLEDNNNITNYLEVLSHINDKNYYNFGGAKTLRSTFSAALGDFIVMETQEYMRVETTPTT